MPAEAIHLSALVDSTHGSSAAGFLGARSRLAEARLGAVTIDLPYFDRFARGVLRYVTKRPVAVSPWGDAFHQQAPVGIGKGLIRAVHRLRHDRTTREQGDRLLAITLGYVSHLAVDTAIHPLVNRMAAARATRLSDRAARQHNEVEKFQSILFHEERNGFDFMGTGALRDHIAVPGRALVGDPVLLEAFLRAVREALGTGPDAATVQRWWRGYTQYVALLSSPVGHVMMPDSVKEEVRGEVYAGAFGRFEHTYEAAVAHSRAYMDACHGYAESAADEAAFDRIVVEGSIDDPPAR